MASGTAPKKWQGADAYEAYMGRWSRPMAQAFLPWFAAPRGLRWLDVGCGTGALTAAILDAADPSAVVGVDPSADFVATATAQLSDPRANFQVGDALALPMDSDAYDVVVAGLVLNHVPEPGPAATDMVRVARPGGLVGGYVWDYAGEMQMIRFFWEAAAATNPDATTHDPRSGSSYRICRPEPLGELFRAAGLGEVVVEAIDLAMRFRDFDDYWQPNAMTGPAAPQRYVATLDDGRKAALQEQLRSTLPIAADGTIDLIGRAWAVRGTKPMV
jgi:SAM-dependent methyltransferase